MWGLNRFATNLVGQNESSDENSMEGPFFGLDGEVGPCPPQVDDRDEDVGEGHLRGVQDTIDERGEFDILLCTYGRTAPGSCGETEGVVDGLCALVNDGG